MSEREKSKKFQWDNGTVYVGDRQLAARESNTARQSFPSGPQTINELGKCEEEKISSGI